tara:strand:+ start:573 stop:908 length:336 start_codon:yes stop_codon:yes gene_type:complete
MITVQIGDRTVEVEAGSRLLNQINNLEEESKQGKFKEARDAFTALVREAVDEITNEVEDDSALEGMAVVYFLSGEDNDGKEENAIQLVQGPRVVIKQRMPRAKSGDASDED